MWEKSFLLLLHCVEAVVASQCWQGATFSQAVVSPAVETSGILHIPGVTSFSQCVAACCDLPGYDLAWLFKGRCYVLSCQQRENCSPQERPGADSILSFVRRASPQTLMLQSLVRGEPYGDHWRPLTRSSEAPGDIQALKDLALFDGAQQDFSDSGMLDFEYPEKSQEEREGQGSEVEMRTDQTPLKGPDGFNQSEAEAGPERRTTESSTAQNRPSSGKDVSQGEEALTERPSDSTAAEETKITQSSTDSPALIQTTDSTQHDHTWTSPPTAASPRQPISTSAQPAADQPLILSFRDPVERKILPSVKPEASAPPEPTADVSKLLQTSANSPTTVTQPSTTAVTFDPRTTTSSTTTAPPMITTPPSAAAAESVSAVRGSNCGPKAMVGPDRKLWLPVSSLTLDGSGSSDDRGVVSYQWEPVSGPPGLKLEGPDQAVATVTGLKVGHYTFRLTVSDQEGATDSASLTVTVQEARSLPPIAHASGSHTLTLPNNSLVLRGSVTDGDQTQVRFLWVRDSQSPAAGEVLYGSETQASLYLANLVEGTYLFQLRVTDAQGRSCAAMATVEVRPEPGGGEEVELEMLVSVSQVSVSQRDTVLRQLAALLHVLDGDIQVRALLGHSHLSTVLRFSVRGPSEPVSGSRIVSLLRNQLLREKSDYLLFRVLRVDTVLCMLHCSGRGQCDPITKECLCDPFWTENLIRRYFGDGESNCEWRVLYVILTSFMFMVLILSVSWTFICCCKRRKQTKVRRKTKYTILDNMDEQERVELRPKFSIKHRSTEHNSSLMMSESELDSDQDTIFSRDRPARQLCSQAARNGNAFG